MMDAFIDIIHSTTTTTTATYSTQESIPWAHSLSPLHRHQLSTSVWAVIRRHGLAHFVIHDDGNDEEDNDDGVVDDCWNHYYYYYYKYMHALLMLP